MLFSPLPVSVLDPAIRFPARFVRREHRGYPAWTVYRYGKELARILDLSDCYSARPFCVRRTNEGSITFKTYADAARFVRSL